ncbi:hypothetical protein HDU67_002710 [Dinochytrium kinnereticum]|nr:hypothetical protein HDU67_002710 [Dinochytrium kinnereticum]
MHPRLKSQDATHRAHEVWSKAVTDEEGSMKRGLRVAFLTWGFGEDEMRSVGKQVGLMERLFCGDREWVQSRYFVVTNLSDEAVVGVTPGEVFEHRVEVVRLRDFEEGVGGGVDVGGGKFKAIVETMLEHDITHDFDFAFWQDPDQFMVDHQCEDMLGTLVGARDPHVSSKHDNGCE